jgi:hypothetical protein
MQIGQKVKLVHSSESAVILQLLPGNRALILIDELLEEEVSLNDIVYADPSDLRQATSLQTVNPEIFAPPGTDEPNQLAEDLYLVLDYVGSATLNIYLLNHTPIQFVYVVYRELPAGEVEARLSGQFKPQSQQLLFSIKQSECEDFSKFNIYILPFETLQPEYPKVRVFEVRIKSKDLLKKKTWNPYLKQPCIQLPLSRQAADPEVRVDTNRLATQWLGDGGSNETKERIILQETVAYEVDLHVEALRGGFGEVLNPTEILEIQLQEFDKALNRGLAQGLHRMVFIHGIGQGRLREAIHARLRKNSKVKGFRLEQFEPYKGGATSVEF